MLFFKKIKDIGESFKNKKYTNLKILENNLISFEIDSELQRKRREYIELLKKSMYDKEDDNFTYDDYNLRLKLYEQNLMNTIFTFRKGSI